MAWTYDSSVIASTPAYQVRLLVGDTNHKDPLLQDEEITWLLTFRRSPYGAAAEACRSLASNYSRQADSVQNELRVMYSARSKAFASRALEFEQKAKMRGGGMIPYAGGISATDKARQVSDGDRVAPQASLGMNDNASGLGGTSGGGASGAAPMTLGDILKLLEQLPKDMLNEPGWVLLNGVPTKVG